MWLCRQVRFRSSWISLALTYFSNRVCLVSQFVNSTHWDVFIAGSTLILGAICLNGIPVAMLMRDPSYLKDGPDEHTMLLENIDPEKTHQVAPDDKPHISSPNESSDWKVKLSKIGHKFGFHLLKNWRFVLFWISASMTYLSHITLHWFIPDRAIEIGLSLHNAAMTITVVNWANVLSRLIFGLTSSEKFFNHVMMLIVYVFISGLSSILVFVWTSYWSYMFFSALFGMLRGLFVIYQLLMIVDLVGEENVSLGLGLIYSLGGLVFLISIPTFGHLNEVTNSYVTTFVLYGGIEILGGVFLLPVLFYSCWAKFKIAK